MIDEIIHECQQYCKFIIVESSNKFTLTFRKTDSYRSMDEMDERLLLIFKKPVLLGS